MSFHPTMPYGTEQWHRSHARRRCPRGRSSRSRRATRAQFEEFAAHYAPEHRKSAVLHALYLAQEQQGYISNNAARHVAEVIGCTTAEVEDVVSYYVMFHRNPVGKYVLQVCTTLSCALAGAERVVEELQHKLGIKAGRDRSDRHVHHPADGVPRRLRPRAGDDGEQRALARVPQARSRPAALVDAMKTDGLKALNGCHLRGRAAQRLAGQDHDAGEVRRRCRTTSRCSRSTRSRPAATRSITTCKNQHGLRGPEEGAGDDARRGDRRRQEVGPARPRRRRLPDRPQVAVRRQEVAEAEVHRLQRRRERAGHLQGSPADGAQSPPAGGGLPHRLLRDRLEGRLHLHPRRVLSPVPGDAEGDRRRAQGRASSARTSSAPASTARSTCIAAPAPTKPAKRRRCSNRSKASARSRASSRRSRRSKARGAARPRSTTSRRSATCRS